MFSKPEFSPITVAGLQCNESVKTASEEAESHHGNCPQDGDGQGFFTVDDPGGEECEAGVQVNEGNDAPGHGE